jgi:hypothetical protein
MANHPNSPFDIASKMIVDADPLAFARLCGPADAVELLDTNFASNVYADRLLKVWHGDMVFLRHIEVQSSYERDKFADAAHYGTGAFRVHKLPVYSAYVLLREEADGPAMTGSFSTGSSVFGFDVLRMWEFPVEKFLGGVIAHLPLVALCDVSAQSLPGLVEVMNRRIKSQASDVDPSSLWVEFDLLLGLKYPPGFVQSLLKGVGHMRESSTYQAILAEGIAEGKAEGIAEGKAVGKTEGKREALMALGVRRFGEPDASARSVLDQIYSLERLDGLFERLLEAESWNELLSH